MGDGSIDIYDLFVERLNYCIYVLLLLIGLWAMLAKRNLIKKLIGMSIFQTAIILFYVSIAVKEDATIPIYLPEHDPHGSHQQPETDENQTNAASGSSNLAALDEETIKRYANPLPHVLMLTAIVVGVATLGLALALCQRIYQGYGTIEEDELLAKLDRADDRASISPLEKKKRNQRRRTTKQRAKPKTAASKIPSSSAGENKKRVKRNSQTPRKNTGSRSSNNAAKSKPKVKQIRPKK